jgi:hypothetical protein
MAAMDQIGFELPQFGRASVRVTHFCQQIHFSADWPHRFSEN